MLKQEMILDPLMLGLANINEWCVKGLELSGECGRVIYELGGMKPGPRSFEGCSLWASEEMVSNQTAFPSTIFMKREREREREEREDCFILIWPCIVFSWALIYVGRSRVSFASQLAGSPTFYSSPYLTFHTIKYKLD